jgi:hypothetical protein
VEEQSYFRRIEEKIREKENGVGRKLTVDEQDELKFKAMQDLFMDTAREEEQKKESAGALEESGQFIEVDGIRLSKKQWEHLR